jgi:hypothetical protein
MDLIEPQPESHHPLPMSQVRFGPKRSDHSGYLNGPEGPHGELAQRLTSASTVNQTALPELEDPWTKIVSALLTLDRSTSFDRRADAITTRLPRDTNVIGPVASAKSEHGRSTLRKNVRVSFVERFGATTVSLTWHDSTQACYDEQRWIRKTARSSGRCALSGTAVRPGDAVYGPASRVANRPLNCTQMILSCMLERLEIESVGSYPNDPR